MAAERPHPSTEEGLVLSSRPSIEGMTAERAHLGTAEEPLLSSRSLIEERAAAEQPFID